MSEITAPSVSLADVERLCWRLSGWKVEQRDVDRLLKAVTAYAGYGPDPSQAQGARPLVEEEPTQGAVRPAETLPTPTAAGDTQDAPTGAQTPVQRVHVTGTFTLVCRGHACKGGERRTRTRKRVPAAERKRAPASPDLHDPALPEDQRQCRTCQTVKPIGDYSRDAHGRRGRKTVCQECENTRKREARKRKAAR